MKDSVELALDHLGGKVGGLETEVIFGDDQRKPDVGKQLADEMLKKHKVHFVSGVIWSNVMLAGAPAVGTFGTARNQQFRCLVNGVQVFAEDLGDANAPQIASAHRSWRFTGANALAGNDPFLLDKAIGWWGDARVYYGP